MVFLFEVLLWWWWWWWSCGAFCLGYDVRIPLRSTPILFYLAQRENVSTSTECHTNTSRKVWVESTTSSHRRGRRDLSYIDEYPRIPNFILNGTSSRKNQEPRRTGSNEGRGFNSRRRQFFLCFLRQSLWSCCFGYVSASLGPESTQAPAHLQRSQRRNAEMRSSVPWKPDLPMP